MLRPGDPVNVGERCHLIVELADVPARGVEVCLRSQKVQRMARRLHRDRLFLGLGVLDCLDDVRDRLRECLRRKRG